MSAISVPFLSSAPQKMRLMMRGGLQAGTDLLCARKVRAATAIAIPAEGKCPPLGREVGLSSPDARTEQELPDPLSTLQGRAGSSKRGNLRSVADCPSHPGSSSRSTESAIAGAVITNYMFGPLADSSWTCRKRCHPHADRHCILVQVHESRHAAHDREAVPACTG